MNWLRRTWKKSIPAAYRYTVWSDQHLPRGARAVLGVLLMVLGVFGFLPILGFWMIPLGAALVALDVPPWRRRMLRWLEAKAKESSTPG
jgi:hypothetical protein